MFVIQKIMKSLKVWDSLMNNTDISHLTDDNYKYAISKSKYFINNETNSF
jgi:hypothetical protein